MAAALLNSCNTVLLRSSTAKVATQTRSIIGLPVLTARLLRFPIQHRHHARGDEEVFPSTCNPRKLLRVKRILLHALYILAARH